MKIQGPSIYMHGEYNRKHKFELERK